MLWMGLHRQMGRNDSSRYTKESAGRKEGSEMLKYSSYYYVLEGTVQKSFKAAETQVVR
jgi:hypothetical protein